MQTVTGLSVAILFCSALAAFALLGMVFDMRHKQRRHVLLSTDRERALVMADYYNHAGGAER